MTATQGALVFGSCDTAMERAALFSTCRKYRYLLSRIWDRSKPKLLFIGLNPSTGNEAKDDPTITRVIGFAKDNGFGAVLLMNLFAFVTPYPKDLLAADDPIGENDWYLQTISLTCSQVLFAWGAFKEARKRDQAIIAMFPDAVCLGKTKGGHPCHPLFLKSSTPFEPFNK